jgi:hypothetical protein
MIIGLILILASVRLVNAKPRPQPVLVSPPEPKPSIARL